MKAILSDVHGNLEALLAVLHDIASHEVDAVYCLGDLIGYGPNPCECVDLATRWPVVLMGNFDAAVLHNPPDVVPAAFPSSRSLLWSQAGLDVLPEGERRREFLAARPRVHQEGDLLFFHGSPRRPLHEYVWPEDVANAGKMAAVFAGLRRYGFSGHTHLPGVFTEEARFSTPEELGCVCRLDGRKALVNVGSVGQPRDGDWRACYALLDGEVVRFRRVEYDVEATVRKIEAIPELENFLGDRLREGW